MENFPKRFWTRFQEEEFKESIALRTVVDGRVESLTFWKWTRRIQNLAMGLMEAGFEPGTRLGMIASNGRDWLDVAMATWLVGGCLVPLRPDHRREQSLHCLGRSGCGWIAVDDIHERDRLRGAGGALPEHLQWVVFDGDDESDDVHPVDDLEEKGRNLVQRGHTSRLARRIYGIGRDDPALVLFEPDPGNDAEGALFSGAKIEAQLGALARQMGLSGEDETVVSSALNFGWFSSFLISVATLYAGDCVGLPSSGESPPSALDELRPTLLVCGPDFLEELAGD